MSTPSRSSSIGFIGAGIVGFCLAITLSRKGYMVKAVASRSRSSAKALASRIDGCVPYSSAQDVVNNCDVVFVTTPDDAIAKVVSSVSWRKGQGVLHCSGAASLDVLEPARRQGAIVGTFHPLQTFSSLDEATKNLPGTTCAIEGGPVSRAFLENVALDLRCRPLFLKPGDKALYHASAVMVCGFTVGLAKLATDLWGSMGFSQEEALAALMPLLRGTVNSLESVGLPQALTGPFARGDVGTVQKHLEALVAKAPEAVLAYCELGLAQLPMAMEKGGLDIETAHRIKAVLESYLHREPSAAAESLVKQ